VKVLDFGLAKAFEGDPSDPKLSQSPTMMLSGTMAGVVLGTAAYMSPEQARGKEVDKLTDVWALGCVLYEMLTGQATFPGETVSDTIAKILEREPDWEALPGDTPPAVQRLLRRCLQKDKTMRLQDVGEVRVEIDGALSGQSEMWSGSMSAITTAVSAPAKKPVAWMAWAAIATVAAAVLGFLYFASPAPEPESVIRTSIQPPEDSRFVSVGDFGGPVVISPDGQRIAYVANNESFVRMLFVRELHDVAPRMIPGTDGCTFPFWSPDGKSVGYFTNSNLMRVDLGGGLPISVCRAANGRGGTWAGDGFIILSEDFRTGISRVPESGGTPVAVTEIDTLTHSTHRWPHVLPDAEHFLFVAAHHDISQADQYGVYFGTVGGGEPKHLVQSAAGAIFANGHLLYLRENTLMAAPFDYTTGEFTGDPVAMVDKIQYDPTTWRASFSASDNGVLAYHPGDAKVSESSLVIVARDGDRISAIEEANAYYQVKVSPDGAQVAVTTGATGGFSSELDIWVYDVERSLSRRLTFQAGADIAPVWSPDGRRVAFARIYVGADNRAQSIRVINASGGSETVLVESFAHEMWTTDWSRDGKYILYGTGSFVGFTSTPWVLRLEDGKTWPVLSDENPAEDSATMSPDGRWIAYEEWDASNNNSIIFVSPFVDDPEADLSQLPKWQVSPARGVIPMWNASGTELYYIRVDGRLFMTKVDGSGGSFEVGDTEVLFTTDPWNFGRMGYDVFGDGDKFLVNAFNRGAANPIRITQNWQLELER
jgi:Tol biopolymer transport system component